MAKARVLPAHLENMRKLSRDQYERELLIARNLELVSVRAEEQNRAQLNL